MRFCELDRSTKVERLLAVTVLAASIVSLSAGCAAPRIEPARPQHPPLDRFFEGFDGAFVLRRLDRSEPAVCFNDERCARRWSPCSTFKVPHALIGLQTGVLKDSDTKFEWDGKAQPIAAWEQDHTLASAMPASCVWYFQRVAKGVGEERMEEFLRALDYGNRDISGGLQRFWLSSSLAISANEQIDFLTKLYRNELPVDARVAKIVRRVLVLESRSGVVLSGKTGSGRVDDGSRVGWFVGHLRNGDEEYVFATNIVGSRRDTWGPKAREISKAVLAELGLWKPETDGF